MSEMIELKWSVRVGEGGVVFGVRVGEGGVVFGVRSDLSSSDFFIISSVS